MCIYINICIYIYIYIMSIFVCMYRYIFLASSNRVVTLEKFSTLYVEVLLCFVFVVFEKSFTCAQRSVRMEQPKIHFLHVTSALGSCRDTDFLKETHVAVYGSVLQCVAVCCSALQCVAVHCSALQCDAVHCSALQCVAVCCSLLRSVAVWCSVVQCVAV